MELKDCNVYSKFILPIILEDNFDVNNFVNAYYEDINYPYVENKIHLVFDLDKEEKRYINIRNKIIKNKYFYNSFVYYDNGNKEKFIFIVPIEYKKDYSLIMLGQYSKTSETYKNKVLTFWNIKTNSSIYNILYSITDDTENQSNRNNKGELIEAPLYCYIKEYKLFEFNKFKRLVI